MSLMASAWNAWSTTAETIFQKVKYYQPGWFSSPLRCLMGAKRVKIVTILIIILSRKKNRLPQAAGPDGELLQLFSHNLLLSLRKNIKVPAYFILERRSASFYFRRSWRPFCAAYWFHVCTARLFLPPSFFHCWIWRLDGVAGGCVAWGGRVWTSAVSFHF